MINFDNAATTFPKPLSIRKAAVHAMNTFGSAGRGGHPLASATSRAVYSARETIADFFGAEPENVVFTLNCTHALNMAIHGIMGGGGHMIISSMEHNSAARPAAKLVKEGKISLSIAQVFPDDDMTVESFRSLIRDDTRAIVCTMASNVTGQRLPVESIAEVCRQRDICLIADGAQACGMTEVSLSRGMNIICTAGHKGLYGITGTGLLISDGRFPIFPMIQGGTGNFSRSLDQPTLLPEALESGTLNIPGIMSLKAGVEFVREKGIANIFAHEDKICRRFIGELKNDPRITIYRDDTAEYVPIVAFNVGDMNSEDVAEILAKKGYCLRAGYHCAALAHRRLGTEKGAVRFSPSVFSREEDAIRLAEVIRSI